MIIQEKPLALFDMDGTLCDYDSAVFEGLEKLYSPQEVRIIDLRKDEEPYLKERINLIRNQVGWWENLKPLKLGFDIYNLLKEIGFDIHILTQGPLSSDSAWTEKLKWCKKYCNGTNITITRDKGLVYGKVLVDDYPDYAYRWLKWRPRGLVIMPMNYRNRDVSYKNIILVNEENYKDKIFDNCKKIVDVFNSEK